MVTTLSPTGHQSTFEYRMSKAGSVQWRNRPESPATWFNDPEGELLFRKCGGHLTDVIALEVHNVNSPLCGCIVGPNDRPRDDEVTCEFKSVYEWGKELAELERRERRPGGFDSVRLLWIVRLLHDYGFIWREGPDWWRTL